MRQSICVLAVLLAAGCGCDEHGSDNPFVCETPEDCYPGIDPADLPGDVVCQDRVEGGYCTHLCTVDDECCSVEGECTEGFVQVCSPLESSPEKYCFYSCEGMEDGEAFCTEYAHSSFHCRSTGGGTENRMVCLP